MGQKISCFNTKIEFLTWYRQYDRPDGTCIVEKPQIANQTLTVGGGSSFGSSEYIMERLSHYVCNSGLLNVNGTAKPSWDEFKNQIDLIN